MHYTPARAELFLGKETPMKVALISVLLLASTSAFAVQPLEAGKTLGVADGQYAADGVLERGVVNPGFHAQRSFQNGVIDATTTATMFGIKVATVSALLKVVDEGEGKFSMLELDRSSQAVIGKAGEGSCDAVSCSFDATVMGGQLELRETFTATDAGFTVDPGAQVYKGDPATYKAEFTRQ
jgi:hypothetical protein